MGYYPEPDEYDLTFDDPALAEAQVRMAGLTVAEFAELLRLSAIWGISEEAVKANDRVLDMFAASLRSWNITSKAGKELPATRESVNGLPSRFTGRLITAWMTALISVPPPLPQESGGGVTSLERSLPMESL